MTLEYDVQSSVPTASLAGLLKGTGASTIGTVAAPSGAVVGTTDTQALTHKDFTDATNTFPTLGVFIPSDYGWISWNMDPVKANVANVLLTAGEAYLSLVPIRQAITITNVILGIGTAGASLTSGQCFAGLFDHNGNLLSATADQSTNWQSAGKKTMALTTPQSVAAGMYYVGWFANGTTMPKFNFDSATSANNVVAGQFVSSPRSVVDTTNTGLTTAFHSPATLTVASTIYFAAVS